MIGKPRISNLRIFAAVILLLGMSAQKVSASLTVELLVTPSVGSFEYEATIINTGPEDFSIVSIFDAPVADPLIGLSLTAPAGFTASYSAGLGIIDFLEDTSYFAAGTSTSGFLFSSLAGPDGFFSGFQAISPDGVIVTGDISKSIRTPKVPEPSSYVLGICGLALIAFARKRCLSVVNAY